MGGNNGGSLPNAKQEERMNRLHLHPNNEGNLGKNVFFFFYNRQNPLHTTENNGKIPPNFHNKRNRNFTPSHLPIIMGLGGQRYPNPPPNGNGHNWNNMDNLYENFDRNPPFEEGFEGQFHQNLPQGERYPPKHMRNPPIYGFDQYPVGRDNQPVKRE